MIRDNLGELKGVIDSLREQNENLAADNSHAGQLYNSVLEDKNHFDRKLGESMVKISELEAELRRLNSQMKIDSKEYL